MNPKIPVETVLMGTELGYQPLLSDSALLHIPKSALEDVYPKIRGRMSSIAEVLPYWEGTYLSDNWYGCFNMFWVEAREVQHHE
eukprot:g37316.t1